MAAQGTQPEFVEGWLVAQVLGEGAYGEVRLLVHGASGARVALKVSRGAGAAAGAREAALQRALRHPHILRCLGARAQPDPPAHYLFLEYAQGGELFDRIEPDVGMPAARARGVWRALLAALRYLRARGVAHRDVKPENLLLDAHERLKLADFGMATVYRHGSRERLLTRVCGTAAYCAPEVLTAGSQPYRAAPADLWSAGVVLLAVLCGELPWERASPEDPRYRAWVAQGTRAGGVWTRVPPAAADLLAGALRPAPAARAGLDQLLLHPWAAPPRDVPDGGRGSSSQPAEWGEAEWGEAERGEADADAPGEAALLALSQPALCQDLMLSQPSTQGMCRVVPQRLTRVRLPARDAAGALRYVRAALAALPYGTRAPRPGTLAIDCDGDVKMLAYVLPLEDSGAGGAGSAGSAGGCVVEFRRSRGCGLHFKRCFLRVRAALQALPPRPAHSAPMDRD